MRSFKVSGITISLKKWAQGSKWSKNSGIIRTTIYHVTSLIFIFNKLRKASYHVTLSINVLDHQRSVLQELSSNKPSFHPSIHLSLVGWFVPNLPVYNITPYQAWFRSELCPVLPWSQRVSFISFSADNIRRKEKEKEKETLWDQGSLIL